MSHPLVLKRCLDVVLLHNTPKGRGIFATARIPSGTVIDVCPVLLLGIEENRNHIEKTSLYHYTYNWPVAGSDGRSSKSQAVVFGLGSMFNHARNQNVGWTRDVVNLSVTYTALRDIDEGEELCISYGDHLTFEAFDADSSPPPSDESDSGAHVLTNIQL